MSFNRKHFLLLTLGFFTNTLLVLSQGCNLLLLLKVIKSTAPLLIIVPLLVISYRAIMFLFYVLHEVFQSRVLFFKNWTLDFKLLKSDCLNTIVVCFGVIYLFVFQTSFKLIYAWALMTPNNVDWLLSTFDRVLIGPTLWWWCSQLMPHSLWLALVVFLDRFYVFYFVLQWFVLMFLLFNDKKGHKNYFITFFLLIWVYGTTLGGLCQSGGPFFFVYASWSLIQMKALMGIHNVIPLYAVQAQFYLWNSYFNQQLYVLSGGISAFPSLHVAMSMFACIYVKALNNELLTKLAYIGVVLTILSSSILGWHYLVDSFGAVFIVYLAQKSATALHKF